MSEYNVDASRKAQSAYCDEKNLPHFAPFDGVCFSCHQQIYARVEHQNPYDGRKSYTGIPTDLAASMLITGCPHCSSSFCE